MNLPSPNHARSFLIGFALLSLPTITQAEPATAQTKDNGKVVQMAPYKVTATFDVRGKFKKGTKTIDYVKITWAAPGFIKAGAKKGDFLVSIDGKPVSGMSGAELTALMDITLEPGVKRTFIFNGKRGLLGQNEWTTTAEFVGNPPKPPASRPAPGDPAKPTAAAVDFF